MFALLPDEDRLEIERALPEFMREKLKIEGLAPKEMKEMLVLGLVERFRFIQGADDQSAARRGGYAGEDTGAEVMDPEAAAAMQAYETWKSQNAEERIPMEAFKSFFAHNVEFQTEYRTWQNEIAAGHMTDEFLAGFEKWSAEDEYKKSLKDVHYEAWWGEKADRSKLIAGWVLVMIAQDSR